MGMLDNENDFKTEMSKGMAQMQADLFMQAWEGWGDSSKNQGSQDDGMGAFLAPLERPLAMIKNATDAEINNSIETALRESIYPS